MSLLFLIILIASFTAHAELADYKNNYFTADLKKNWEKHVPETLKKWIPWLLKDYQPKDCPFSYNNLKLYMVF